MSEQPLSKKLQYWRAERPDEWTMDEFIRDAGKLEISILAMGNLVNDLTEENNRLKEGK